MRGSRRSCVSTRAATARVIRAFMPRPLDDREERRLDVLGAGASRGAAGVSSAMSRPSRMSSSRSQRSASSITWLDTIRPSPASASRWNSDHSSRRSTGSRPTVGSSSTSRSGLASRATASEARLTADRRERRRPPGRAAVGEADRLDRRVDLDCGRRRAPGRRRAGSRARSGRRTRSAPASRSRPGRAAAAAGRLPEHRHGAGLDDLHADDRAHQGGLAAAGGTQQPGDRRAADVGRAREHGASAADDARSRIVDRRYSSCVELCSGDPAVKARVRRRSTGPVR